MNDLYRLLRYAKPYIPALLLSVIFMAVVGLSQGLLAEADPAGLRPRPEARCAECTRAAVLHPGDHFRVYLERCAALLHP